MTTKVFILEDEMIHAEALKITLEEAGLDLAGECGDADLAFELIEASHPDVLLADIALPGYHNGITVAGRVRRELGIPHIFITSFTREEMIRQAVETQPAGYLRKPVDPVNLRAAVEIALHSVSSSIPPSCDEPDGIRSSGLPSSPLSSSGISPSGGKAPLPAAAGVASSAPELLPRNPEKLRTAHTGGWSSPEQWTTTPSPAPIFTRVGDKLVRIHPEDLLMVRADGENYIALVFEKKEISCRTTLKEFCSQLPPCFIQVHRGFYINLRHLDAFHEGEQTVSLKGRQAPVGRSFRKAFLDSVKRV